MTFAQVRTIELPTHVDARGALTSLEPPRDLPFEIARIFWLHGVEPSSDRGGHAHALTDHLLVCMCGSMKVDVTDGKTSATHTLDNPQKGLLIPKMVWMRLYEFAPGTICLAAASARYDRSNLIREWDAFLGLAGV